MARFVLVHGAFGGAWTWGPVIEPLRALGHTVDAIDLPGAGDDVTPVEDVTLARYAETVVAAIAARPDPAVLVGYSMGGVAVTQAAANAPDLVTALVFVAAFMPANGQSLVDLTKLPEGAGDMIQANLIVEGDPPVGRLSDEATMLAVYNRTDPERAATALARRRPQPLLPMVTPVEIDDDVLTAIPRFYVHTLADNSIPPVLQKRMMSEHPCRGVVELDADHAPQLSATEELVAALDGFARGV